MASLCALACERSSASVMASALATFPLLWSTITSANRPSLSVYTESCSLPSSSSNFAEIGGPSLPVARTLRRRHGAPDRPAHCEREPSDHCPECPRHHRDLSERCDPSHRRPPWPVDLLHYT